MRKIFTSFILLFSSVAMSQVYTNKPVGKNIDTLSETKEYPYILPILGAKATKKGYQLPYSAGLSINMFSQQSDLILDNLSVGFNNGPMYNIDEIVRFNSAKSAATAVTIRPDVWLFPFLNVYGILGQAHSSTSIDIGLWAPNENNQWGQLTTFQTKANFTATSYGFGATPTFGIAGCWMALDMNAVWTDVSALNKPVFTSTFGPRLGKTFKFKKPERNIAVWVGGFRVNFSSKTEGSMNLNELISTDEFVSKVDQGQENVAQKNGEVNTWWEGLTPAEQKNPINAKKYETATRALNTAENFLNAAEGAASTVESSTVQYSLDKNLKDKWNFIVGSQFQINRHFMVRLEYGFMGSRQQIMTGLQYRFGL